jgi:hypothetical protein
MSRNTRHTSACLSGPGSWLSARLAAEYICTCTLDKVDEEIIEEKVKCRRRRILPFVSLCLPFIFSVWGKERGGGKGGEIGSLVMVLKIILSRWNRFFTSHKSISHRKIRSYRRKNDKSSSYNDITKPVLASRCPRSTSRGDGSTDLLYSSIHLQFNSKNCKLLVVLTQAQKGKLIFE